MQENIFQSRDNLSPLAFQTFSAVTWLTMVCPQIFGNPKILESTNVMIAIVAAFPRRTPCATAHVIFHISDVAQSSWLSFPPLPLPPVAEEGGPLLSLISTHRPCQGPGVGSLPAPCSRQQLLLPILFGEGGRGS
jgi:hypothetical protein